MHHGIHGTFLWLHKNRIPLMICVASNHDEYLSWLSGRLVELIISAPWWSASVQTRVDICWPWSPDLVFDASSCVCDSLAVKHHWIPK
jgi:hypothetical protein